VEIEEKVRAKNLWLIRLYYLFYFGAMGAISPFINLFYIHNGLSGTEIGLLGTISALVGFLAAPIWGRLNDVARRPRVVLQVALCANSLAYYFLSQQTAFLYMAIIIAFNALVSSGINPQSQTQALAAAGKMGTGYGSIRMFGSLGFSITAVTSGYLIQQTSLVTGFYAFGILNVISALILFTLRTPRVQKGEQIPADHPPKLPMRQVFAEILKNRELVAYMFALIAISILANGVSFESVYMQRLGASASVIGRLGTFGALSEIPMMLVADRVMRRKGSTTTLIFSFIFYALGLSIIVIHPSITTFFVYRFVNAIAFSMNAVSCTYFVVERAPAKQIATILALFSVTISSIISMIASPISGKLFDLVGPYWLYVNALVGYCIAVLIVYFKVIKKKKTKQCNDLIR
jgi:MFS transporter, PPP family, 3-phenylpropionic acid transporter